MVLLAVPSWTFSLVTSFKIINSLQIFGLPVFVANTHYFIILRGILNL